MNTYDQITWKLIQIMGCLLVIILMTNIWMYQEYLEDQIHCYGGYPFGEYCIRELPIDN